MTGLRPRERVLAIGLTALAAGLGVYGWVIRPAIARVHTLQRVIPEKQHELRELADKTRQVAILASRLAVVRQALDSQPAVEILPAVESVLGKLGLQTHLTSLKEQTAELDVREGQAVVEVTLQKLSLKQVLDFLQAVQTAIPSVRVSSIHLSRHPQDPGLLNVTATLRKPTVVDQTPAS